MQTEKAKSSHFDRTRGDKNQIFPTQVILRVVIGSLAHLMALKGWVELMFQIQLFQNSILMICVALVKLFKLLIYQCLVFLELLHMI